ncbi:endonuclease/exonuclease/phosphatase family protein [Paenibacillus chondroitinus]|uniref:Endonuclease/exonuclease/phosphatase family protein n=1 Tax=Paenibacillus chondroitinus TaxID=59842 RepID=A0ABU6DAV8_9BACL|nr:MULTISPECIES: endonuclease/exonuclease/phosphatase family protein [Paenibacillus]MCY9657490.1 endonuclease/exonuclease/phosphatase family protein [Paenibacillus anseongense]MEB4794890.1 endonuclease/exonuclease/phosphatase family protein [Paenibacillus chondroitinus]
MAYVSLRLARCIVLIALLVVVLGSPIQGWDKGLLSNIPVMPAASTEAPASFTVMSFNMHHGEGMDGKVDIIRIADLLRHGNADIIALQEVDRYRLRSGFVDQARELSEMLGMHMVYSPSLTYKVGQYGTALLSRYPIVDSSWALLPGNLETRSLLMTTIQVGSEPVHVATTHLGLSEEDRRLQLTRILELLADQQGPLVVAGDFNMEEDAFPVKMNRMSLMDVPISKASQGTFEDGQRIDYVFANVKNSGSAWTVPTIFSDHFPVIARFIMGSAARV